MPQIASQWKNTSQFEQKDGKVNKGRIGNGVATEGGNASYFMEMFPQGFDGFVGSPQCGNAGLIAFQFCSCDDTISGMEMDEHSGHRDIGKSENVIIESGKVEAVNSSEKLFFQLGWK